MLTKLLLRLCQKDKAAEPQSDRARYARLAGWVGVFCNIVLFAAKLSVGIFLHSVSVMADSFNNLSDSASSVITLVGFQFSAKPADREHPFGHGRGEYIAAFIVSFLILLVGYEFLKTSVQKIIAPEAVLFHWPAVCLLVLSIVVKLWLSGFNRLIGQMIGSQALSATAADSRNDVMITAVTVFSVLFTRFTGVVIDGYAGALVALFILYSGFGIAKETLSPLLGEPAAPALSASIKSDILSYPGIVGAHDLIIHNYGPDKMMATIHAEIPANIDMVTAHAIIDQAETEIGKKHGLLLVVHPDPFFFDDERLALLRATVDACLRAETGSVSAHDYRLLYSGDSHRLIFDLQVPHHYKEEEIARLKAVIENQVRAVDAGCVCVINAEHGFDSV